MGFWFPEAQTLNIHQVLGNAAQFHTDHLRCPNVWRQALHIDAVSRPLQWS